MSDGALVIGCDDYPMLGRGRLRAAVRDALAVREWLLHPEGGRLTPAEITFLASCTDEGAAVQADQIDGPASRAAVARAVRALVQGPAGRRLYVYFAGHGCRTDPLNPLKSRDAVLLTDFTPDDPAAGAVGVEDLKLRLAMAPFREIVVIVDACRNLPFREPFDLAALGPDVPPRGGGQGGAPRFCVLQATAPGETAVGNDRAGELRGVVSRALTDGLAGAGAAKIFDERDVTGLPYQVRWSTLCRYVAQSVRGQDPRHHAEGDPVLAAFGAGRFAPVRLQVAVDPGPATPEQLAALEVQVTWPRQDSPDDGKMQLPGPAPVALELPPRRHRVSVRAGPLFVNQWYDVYADQSVSLSLRRPRRAFGHEDRRAFRGEDLGIGLDITADDPAAVLQVRDSSGTVHQADVHHLRADLPPGSYTAVMIGPGGMEEFAPADASPGERTSLRMAGDADLGWPRRPGDLAWASPAAWVAAADPSTWSGLQHGAGVVAVAIESEQPDAEGRASGTSSASSESAGSMPPLALTAVRARPGLRAMTVHTHLMIADPPRAAVFLADLRIQLPCLEGVVTSVVVRRDSVTVALFDVDLLEDPLPVVLLDRAQHLLGAGRAQAAEELLRHVQRGRESRVAQTLLARIRSSSGDLEPVRAASPDAAANVLGGTPWAVLVTPA